MARLSGLVAVLCIAAAAPAFARTIFVDVSGFAAGPIATGTTYVLRCDCDEAVSSSLEFREYADQVERALLLKGARRVADSASAELEIDVGYGISAPQQETVSGRKAIWGEKDDDGLRTFTGNAQHDRAVQEMHQTRGVIGYADTTSTVIVYSRWLKLRAYDMAALRAGGKRQERWSIQAISTGDSGDLREVLPAMAFAAAPYLGTDTGKAVQVKTKEKSKEYKAFLAQPVTDGR